MEFLFSPSAQENEKSENKAPVDEWDAINNRIQYNFDPKVKEETFDQNTLTMKLTQWQNKPTVPEHTFAKQLKHDYGKFISQNPCYSESFLSHLLESKATAKYCPVSIFRVILHLNPHAIETADDEKIHSLTYAIKNTQFLFARAMIEFMDKIQSDRELENKNGEGRMCIKVAFEAMNNKAFPVPLVLKLVGWATEPMLKEADQDQLTPLHRAVAFWTDSQHQLELVKAILDRCEGSLYIKVPKRRIKFYFGDVSLLIEVPTPCSVYQWQKLLTKEVLAASVRRKMDAQSGNSSMNEKDAQPAHIEPKRTHRSKPVTPGNFRRNSIGPDIANLEDNGAPFEKVSERLVTSEKEAQNADAKEHEPGMKVGGDVSQEDKTKTDQNTRFLAAKVSNDNVATELQLRYLRSTMEIQTKKWTDESGDESFSSEGFHINANEAKSFLDEDKQDVHLSLDLSDHPLEEPLKEKEIKKFYKNRELNKILRYVALPQAMVNLDNDSYSRSGYGQPRDQEGRLSFFFDWLRTEKKVSKILQVIVDDMNRPHYDEDIEHAIGLTDRSKRSFDVEILQWRKPDLCPKTIQKAAPNVRELHLEWSGSNSVLRGWSDDDGLPTLESLSRIHLTYTQGIESTKRTADNISDFSTRLENCRSKRRSPQDPSASSQQENNATQDEKTMIRKEYPKILVIPHPITPRGAEVQPPTEEKELSSEAPKHRWQKYMEDFIDLVPGIPKSAKDSGLSSQVMDNVTIALIDDGVDVFSKDMSRFNDQILDGGTFDRANSRRSHPEFFSLNGH